MSGLLALQTRYVFRALCTKIMRVPGKSVCLLVLLLWSLNGILHAEDGRSRGLVSEEDLLPGEASPSTPMSMEPVAAEPVESVPVLRQPSAAEATLPTISTIPALPASAAFC
jgi:hypothetical protein